MLTAKIVPNDKNNPPGKLADAELWFSMPDPATFHASLRSPLEALADMKLIGFGIWERRTGAGRNVTFPARQYSVNGERRSLALLRPTSGDISANLGIRNLILDAYAKWERDQKDGVDGKPEHEGATNNEIDY